MIKSNLVIGGALLACICSVPVSAKTPAEEISSCRAVVQQEAISAGLEGRIKFESYRSSRIKMSVRTDAGRIRVTCRMRRGQVVETQWPEGGQLTEQPTQENRSASAEPPLYLVTILSSSGDTDSLVAFYSEALQDERGDHGVRLLTSPIAVSKQLENEWLPETASAFPGEYVLIEMVPGAAALEAYLADAGDEFATYDEMFDSEIRFAGPQAPNPGPQQFPPIGTQPLRGGDAFILLNATSFAPPEESQPLIMQYFSVAGPIVGGAGTRFYGTIANGMPITGTFPHQALFLSEWASEEAFEAVHNNADWQGVAPYRNSAVTSFTEAKGLVTDLPSGGD